MTNETDRIKCAIRHIQTSVDIDPWAMEIAVDAMERMTKQQWIPCSERLPDKEGMYLVTDDAGGVIYIHNDGFFYYDDGAPAWLLSQNVVAWMPLPEPYKEGEG